MPFFTSARRPQQDLEVPPQQTLPAEQSLPVEPYHKEGPELRAKASLPEVIESLGTGLYQVRVALLAGPVWFADGAELILVSSISETVSDEWNFSAFQRGFVVSLVYFGVFCGNMLSGPAGDYMGRRLPILISFLLIFLLSLLSTCSWGFWSLGIFRLLVGAAIGFGQPAQQALVAETTPAKFRIIFTSVGMYLFSVGEAYSGFLLLADDPWLKDLHWRTLLVAGAVPSVVFGLLAFAFLPQSPLFLALEGRYEETQEVLETMRNQNRAPEVCIDFKPHRVLCGGSSVQHHFRRMLGTVLGPEFCTTTLVIMFGCFTSNLVYYGALYSFPLVLAHGVHVGANPATGVILGALMEVPGYTAGVISILCFPRITVMKGYLFLMATVTACFAIGAPREDAGTIFGVLTMLGYYGIKFVVGTGFLVFYLYASEVFPTNVRTTGCAVAFAGGRVAAMLGSVVYEMLASVFGRFEYFFWIMSMLCLVNFMCIGLLHIETFGRAAGARGESSKEGEDYGSMSFH